MNKNQIIETITTTEIQREPSHLYNIGGDYKIILKQGRQVSVLLSIDYFKRLLDAKKRLNKSISLSKKAVKLINKVRDPLKYQKNIRNEY